MRALRYLLLPWWAVQIGTGAKAFSDNPLLGSRRLNARGLHAARVRLADRLAWMRRRRLKTLVDAETAAAFDRDGFVCLPDFLPPTVFADLRDQLFAFEGQARETIQGDTITRRYAIDREMIAAVPALEAVLRDPCWRRLLRYVASDRSEPLFYIQTILSHRYDAGPDPQTQLHSDTFHPTMKAWLFLTDVAADEGPFAYVPGSHRLTPERLAWEKNRSLAGAALDRLSSRGSLRIAESELPALGLPPPRVFAVKANTLVVADTHGFHARMRSARSTVRVEIWAYGRRNPFLAWTGLNPASLPGIAERRVPLYWWLIDRFPKRRQWHPVGRKRPAEP